MSPDTELRVGILAELGTATQHRVTEDEISLYLRTLDKWSTSTFSETCSRLMQSSKYFPRVAEIHRMCRVVQDEAVREEVDAEYTRQRKEWIPQARAELWMAHLKAVTEALKAGDPLPPSPEPFDTSTVTYKCHYCQDRTFRPACDCGKPSCQMCRYHYVERCFCHHGFTSASTAINLR